jgi:hypothetical protein
MKRFLKLSVFFLSIIILSPTTAIGQSKKGDPKNVVIAVEYFKQGLGTDLPTRMRYCPVDKQKKFSGMCHGKDYVHNIITAHRIKRDPLVYYMNWQTPRPAGLYAFSRGDTQRIVVGPVTTSDTAIFKSGTVAVYTYPFESTKAEQNAAIKRVRAVFVEKYGSEVAKKMKFIHFKEASVKCTLKKAYVGMQINLNKCTLN